MKGCLTSGWWGAHQFKGAFGRRAGYQRHVTVGVNPHIACRLQPTLARLYEANFAAAGDNMAGGHPQAMTVNRKAGARTILHAAFVFDIHFGVTEAGAGQGRTLWGGLLLSALPRRAQLRRTLLVQVPPDDDQNDKEVKGNLAAHA
jgi:hypothetical protein